MPLKRFDQFKTFDEIKDDFLGRLEYQKVDPEATLSVERYIKREVGFVNKGIIEFQNSTVTYNILSTFLQWLEELLESEQLKKKKKPKVSGKLQWNEDKHLLTNLFYQLKNITTKNNIRLVPNTVDEIALFLKENFDCFEETSISTLTTQLTKKEKQPKKVKIEIQLSYT